MHQSPQLLLIKEISLWCFHDISADALKSEV
jgi:hypothetical protein